MFLSTILILLTSSIISINIAYYADPIQVIKNFTRLNRLKLLNCPMCLTPYVTFGLLFAFSSFSIFPMIGISLCNMILTILLKELFKKEVDLYV